MKNYIAKNLSKTLSYILPPIVAGEIFFFSFGIYPQDNITCQDLPEQAGTVFEGTHTFGKNTPDRAVNNNSTRNFQDVIEISIHTTKRFADSNKENLEQIVSIQGNN
jgi:hypothetical protein